MRGCYLAPAMSAEEDTSMAHAEAVQTLQPVASATAAIAGSERVVAIGAACRPPRRERGFPPPAAVGGFGSAAATGKLGALSAEQLAHAFGLAASSASGLFAFVNGGADIKRLHAGHAAREGLQAVLLAEHGMQGPPGVIEERDGFMQAFAAADKARAIALPPAVPFGITDCYIKPYPCCRHIQPAVEALIGLLNDENLASEEVERIEVATYRIAAEHAQTGWDDFASAQLSFPYLIGLALKFRAIRLEHFADEVRRDPAFAAIGRKLTVTAPADVDRRYPQLRPARVTGRAARGSFTRHAEEALGSRIVPLDDAGLKAKFLDLVGPVLGTRRANELVDGLWSVDAIRDVAPLVESMAKPA